MFSTYLPMLAIMIAFGMSFLALYLKNGITKITLFFISFALCFASSLSAKLLNVVGYEEGYLLAIIPILFGVWTIFQYRKEQNERKITNRKETK